MGNSIVKDFQNVRLGKGTVPAEEMIAAGSMVLTRPATILMKWDDHRKSTIYFDLATMLPLFVTTIQSRRKGASTSVTKDDKGRTLFITIKPSRTKHLIYRAPEEDPTALIDSNASIDSNSGHASTTSSISLKDFLESGYDDPPPRSRSKSDSASGRTPKSRPKLGGSKSFRHIKSSNADSKSLLSSSDHAPPPRSCRSDASNDSCSSFALDADMNSSNHSSTSNSNGRSQFDDQVPCAAQIKVNISGGVVTASMAVSVPSKTGTEFVVCYKASKIPAVKFGVLITDMTGEVVGKSSLEEGRTSPVIRVAAGADLPCVLAIASVILRDF